MLGQIVLVYYLGIFSYVGRLSSTVLVLSVCIVWVYHLFKCMYISVRNCAYHPNIGHAFHWVYCTIDPRVTWNTSVHYNNQWLLGGCGKFSLREKSTFQGWKQTTSHWQSILLGGFNPSERICS